MDPENPKSLINILLAFINQDRALPCIAGVDRIRLTALTLLRVTRTDEIGEEPVWWSRLQGPCSINDPEAFASKFDTLKITIISSTSALG